MAYLFDTSQRGLLCFYPFFYYLEKWMACSDLCGFSLQNILKFDCLFLSGMQGAFIDQDQNIHTSKLPYQINHFVRSRQKEAANSKLFLSQNASLVIRIFHDVRVYGKQSIKYALFNNVLSTIQVRTLFAVYSSNILKIIHDSNWKVQQVKVLIFSHSYKKKKH